MSSVAKEAKATTVTPRDYVIVVGVLLVLVFAFGLWSWVDRYQFSSTTLKDGESFPIRIQRITGRNEVLYHGTWQPSTILSGLEKPLESLPEEDLAKLKTDGKTFFGSLPPGDSEDWDGSVDFNLTVYNGSDFILKELTIEVVVKDFDGGEALRRSYTLISHSLHRPKESNDYFTSPLGFTPGPRQTLEWKIIAAKGIRY